MKEPAVKDTPQTTIGRFLDRPLTPDDRDKDNFDLEREFAKSAKNRSRRIPVSVAIFFVVLALGAWGASWFTAQASAKSSVSIGSFEDLKLKEIFDTARKNKKALETLQAQMADLTQASAARVAALQQAGASKADIASVSDPSGEKAKAILAQTAQAVAAEKSALTAALGPLRAQADEAQKKVDSYDSRIGDLNKKNQQVLDSQQRLFEIEKQKLTAQYEARIQALTDEASATSARLRRERDDLVAALKAKHAEDIRELILKYNPVIADPATAAWLAAAEGKSAVYPAYQWPARIADRNLLPADLQSSLAQRVERTRQLLARLRQIPYENSVPPLLNALDQAVADSLTGYDGFLAPLADHMAALDGEITRRDGAIVELQADLAATRAAAALEKQASVTTAAGLAETTQTLSRWMGGVATYAATLKEDGLVVDPSASDDLVVVLKADRSQALAAALAAPAAEAVPGKPAGPPVNQALVRDGQTGADLGLVLLTPADGRWKGEVVKLNDPKRPLKAFDRVVLSLPAKK